MPLYAYAGYPLLLLVVRAFRRRPPAPDEPAEWPPITISLPCYNEERTIRDTLERILDLDYPRDRRQIVVISDASTDATDEIVEEFAPRGVQLIRVPTH